MEVLPQVVLILPCMWGADIILQKKLPGSLNWDMVLLTSILGWPLSFNLVIKPEYLMESFWIGTQCSTFES